MTPVFFDATKLDSYPSMVEETIKQAGKIDILVNNYGIGQPADDLDLIHGKEEAFFHIIEQNLGSVYRITKLVLPHMIQKGSGSIINISSIGGIIPDITRIGYGVSKAAVNNITATDRLTVCSPRNSRQRSSLSYSNRCGTTAYASDIYRLFSLPCTVKPHGETRRHR